MKVKILIPYYSNIDGKMVLHKPGDIVGISDSVVHKFVKAGFAAYIEQPDRKAEKWQS